MTLRSVHVAIIGRVQGVGYRAWVEAEAATLGLGGWVRNRRDGSVEAVFAGESDAVEEMLQRCRAGPPAARVDDIVTRPAPEPATIGFTVLPTA